jgi:hypothetical protein
MCSVLGRFTGWALNSKAKSFPDFPWGWWRLSLEAKANIKLGCA